MGGRKEGRKKCAIPHSQKLIERKQPIGLLTQGRTDMESGSNFENKGKELGLKVNNFGPHVQANHTSNPCKSHARDSQSTRDYTNWPIIID